MSVFILCTSQQSSNKLNKYRCTYQIISHTIDILVWTCVYLHISVTWIAPMPMDVQIAKTVVTIAMTSIKSPTIPKTMLPRIGKKQLHAHTYPPSTQRHTHAIYVKSSQLQHWLSLNPALFGICMCGCVHSCVRARVRVRLSLSPSLVLPRTISPAHAHAHSLVCTHSHCTCA